MKSRGSREWAFGSWSTTDVVCTLGKMLDLSDARLLQSGIKHNDECMSGGAFFVNKTRWISEERTAKWEYCPPKRERNYIIWGASSSNDRLSPTMATLVHEIIMDMKGRECHRSDLEPGILHPVKTVQNNTALFEQIHGGNLPTPMGTINVNRCAML